MSDDDTGPVDTGIHQADIAAELAAQAAQPEVAEAEQAEVAEDADEQNEPEAEAAPDGKDAPAPPKPKGVGKRIDELTRDKYDAIRRAEMAEQRLYALEQERIARQTPQTQAIPQGKPTLEAFGYDQEAYTEALTDWKVQERFQALQAQQQQAQQQQKVVETLTKFQERVASVDPDEWQWAVEANPPTSPVMLEVIAESEVGPQLGIYLAKHPDEAAAIARMPPAAAARSLGRIEERLSAPVAPNPVPPKTVTKAPAPVSTLRPAAPIKKDLGDMDMDEYIAERTRQRKAAGLIR